MPSAYRFEISANNRALCQNKDCKDAGLKIMKGQLRFGTWTSIPKPDGSGTNDSWKWALLKRSRGCITPKQISNVLGTIGGLAGLEDDLDILDGYDDLDSEWKGKILRMLQDGHVPDEDWKGDVEYNRPGKTGMHKRTPKKKAQDKEDGGDSPDDNVTPSKPKAKKGRGKKAAAEANGDDEDGEPTPAKKKAAPKKRKAGAAAPESGADELAVGMEKTAAPKKRKSGHLALVEAGNEDKASEEKPAKKSRAKKTKKEETPPAEEEEFEDAGLAERPKPTAKKLTAKKAEAMKMEQLDGPADADPQAGAKPAPSKKAGGRKAPPVAQLGSPAHVKPEADSGAEIPDSKPAAKRGRAKKAAKVENVEKVAHLPAEAEPETEPAPELEEETKPKGRGNRKKGTAKAKDK